MCQSNMLMQCFKDSHKEPGQVLAMSIAGNADLSSEEADHANAAVGHTTGA